jgi:hypothetical protein
METAMSLANDESETYHRAQSALAKDLFVRHLTPEVSGNDWQVAVAESAIIVRASLDATSQLTDVQAGLVKSAAHLGPLRHLLAPPASQDRFKLLCPAYLKDAENKGRPLTRERAEAIAWVVGQWRNKSLTAWLDEGRQPTEAQIEIVVTAVSHLIATQRVGTVQRNRLADAQEQSVVKLLMAKNWIPMPSQPIDQLTTIPPKHFMRKTRFSTRNLPQEVDIACGLGKTVVCAMECKVTNDSTNSIKSVNDILKKATAWQEHWGSFVKTAALLQGVVGYKDVARLLSANVRVFWSHDLDRFGEWIDSPT